MRLLQALERLRVIESAKLERTLHALSCRLHRIRPHRPFARLEHRRNSGKVLLRPDAIP